MRKVKRKSKRSVIQTHHITYMPERTVVVFKGEHYVLTLLQWRKKVSKGFLEALKQYIEDKEDSAQNLTVNSLSKSPHIS